MSLDKRIVFLAGFFSIFGLQGSSKRIQILFSYLFNSYSIRVDMQVTGSRIKELRKQNQLKVA